MNIGFIVAGMMGHGVQRGMAAPFRRCADAGLGDRCASDTPGQEVAAKVPRSG